jgi:hypothetical protein
MAPMSICEVAFTRCVVVVLQMLQVLHAGVEPGTAAAVRV